MQDFIIHITQREGGVEREILIMPQEAETETRPVTLNTVITVDPPKLEWSKTLCDGERVNYATAEKACAALGEGWRLPTRVELESILDLSRHNPACDPQRFPDMKTSYYWTSTTYAANPAFAWIVSFYLGYVNYGHRGNGYAFVRAVRSSPRQ